LVLEIKDTTNYSSSNCSLAGNCQISLEWSGSNQERIDFWQLEYKLNEGEWQTIFSQTTAKELEDFELSLSFIEDRLYKFRLRTKDKLKKEWTNWQEFELDLSNSVIINEIAIVGTTADYWDQWIELYNRTDKTINLTGWQLQTTGSSLNLEGEIPANGYFLLEVNDEVISNMEADQITHSWDFDYALFLKNKNGKDIDKYYLSDSNIRRFRSECVDEYNNHYSLERVSPYSLGSGSIKWKVNDGETINRIDKKGNQIFGTPKIENSCYQDYTPFSGSIIEDFVFKKSLSPFLFTSDVEVYASSTLIIEPGTKIMFEPGFTELTVNGILKAVGTEEEKIIFTSFKDDPGVGDWYKIHFSNSNNSELEHVIVEYAGNKGSWPGKAAIVVENSSISIKHSEISNNKTSGISLENSYSTIEDCQIHNHSSNGLELKGGGYSKILDSTFEENNYGISTNEANPQISNSTFKRNHYGIYISDGQPQLINPIFGQGDDKNDCNIYYKGECLTYDEYKEK